MLPNTTLENVPETPGLVSVVLLNWNGGGSTELAIKSVIDQSYPNIQLVLVDNCSSDQSLHVAEQLLANQSQIQFVTVRNQSNLGFAKGMNCGIKIANGEFILPMGQDVFLDRDYLNYAVDKFRSNSEIGVIGGVEWEWPDSSDTDFEAKEPRKNQGPHFLNRYFRSTKGAIGDGLERCFGVTGSFPVMRRNALSDVLERTGDRYDEMFVTGYEDMDLWYRLNLCGWLVFFTAETGAWHVGSGSVGGKQGMFEKDLEYQKRIFRNRYFILMKNCSRQILLKNLLYLSVFELSLPFYLLVFQRASVRSYCSAIGEVFSARKVILSKRQRVQSESQLKHGELLSLFR